MDGNPYPDETPVLVRYPTDDGAPREDWPWLPGSILEQCGPDEGRCVVEVRALAHHATPPMNWRTIQMSHCGDAGRAWSAGLPA